MKSSENHKALIEWANYVIAECGGGRLDIIEIQQKSVGIQFINSKRCMEYIFVPSGDLNKTAKQITAAFRKEKEERQKRFDAAALALKKKKEAAEKRELKRLLKKYPK